MSSDAWFTTYSITNSSAGEYLSSGSTSNGHVSFTNTMTRPGRNAVRLRTAESLRLRGLKNPPLWVFHEGSYYKRSTRRGRFDWYRLVNGS